MCVGKCIGMYVLLDIAVEAAFPQCAFSKMDGFYVWSNERAMLELEDGTGYHGGYTGYLVSGSRPEGLALEDDWGHDSADLDKMYLMGGPLGVNVVGGQQSRGKSCQNFCIQGCPAAYCKLEVIDLPGLRKHWISKHWRVHILGEKYWLDTFQAVRGMDLYGPISGPASSDGTEDIVPALICNGTHPNLHQEFQNRPRQWPPTSLIAYLLQLPMLLVFVGHKLSPEFNLQARISCSYLELKLIKELPESVRQGYIACKYVIKSFLKARRGQNEAGDGRSRVGSYHIKTVFLRYLEKRAPSMITSPFRLFLELFHDLDMYIKARKLPHYFLADCNLLETVEYDELHITQQVIDDILSEPLKALLTSPTDPQQIYGNVCPEKLVVAFHSISSHQTRGQYRNLSELLARVDERRQQRYTEQLDMDDDEDEDYRVSGRTKLTGLVDMLKQIKPI